MDKLRLLEKKRDISQDELRRALEQLQKLTDGFIASAEQARQDKEAKLREV